MMIGIASRKDAVGLLMVWCCNKPYYEQYTFGDVDKQKLKYGYPWPFAFSGGFTFLSVPFFGII